MLETWEWTHLKKLSLQITKHLKIFKIASEITNQRYLKLGVNCVFFRWLTYSSSFTYSSLRINAGKMGVGSFKKAFFVDYKTSKNSQNWLRNYETALSQTGVISSFFQVADIQIFICLQLLNDYCCTNGSGFIQKGFCCRLQNI